MKEMFTQAMLQKMQDIYNYMSDERSKRLYLLRLSYNITKDSKILEALIEDYISHCFSPSLHEIRQSHEKVCIYGGGECAKSLYNILLFLGIEVQCFYDRDPKKHNTDLFGKPVCPLPDHTSFPVIIAINYITNEVYEQLVQGGIDPKQLYIFWQTEEYFDKEIISFFDKEVFVDGGCYNFANSLCLNALCPNVEKIYAFEPNPNKKQLIEACITRNGLENVHFFDKGLWSEPQQLRFNIQENMEAASRLNNAGETVVNVVSLDEAVAGDKVTFIKLDIEGAELEALKGARNTIQTYRPKLAICVYHKPVDIIDIPLYIKELVPEYKLYLRHYNVSQNDTVLYAVL